MKNSKTLIICVLLSLFAPIVSFSQQCSLEVSTKVVDAKNNASNGSITFLINNSEIKGDNGYVIFNLSEINGAQGQTHIQLKNGFAGSLSKGVYEFLVVDKNREQCFKEIQVEIKERTDEQ